MVASRDSYRIAIKPKALGDIAEIRAFIAIDSEQNADAFASKLLDAAESHCILPT